MKNLIWSGLLIVAFAVASSLRTQDARDSFLIGQCASGYTTSITFADGSKTQCLQVSLLEGEPRKKSTLEWGI